MKLNALLMSRNPSTLRTLGGELNKIGIHSEWCPSAQDTMELLVRGNYSGLLLDFDLPEATQVAKVARMLSPQQRPVIFAMIGPATPIGGIFQCGANFVLYKPFDAEQVSRTLRAGRGFMQPNRRQSPRRRIAALVHLEFPIGSVPAIVLDLSEQGLALQAPEALPQVQKIPLRFALPGAHAVSRPPAKLFGLTTTGARECFFRILLPRRESI
ncbi:MAG: PilZ domain-containing protein [Acidobacteriaceae bacterium]